MKLSELIQTLEGLKEKQGDVEFQFDWGADSSPILEKDVNLNYDEYSDSYYLSFYSMMGD
jgi:hypothetical protein